MNVNEIYFRCSLLHKNVLEIGIAKGFGNRMNVHMKGIWNKMNRKLYKTRLYENMQFYYKF